MTRFLLLNIVQPRIKLQTFWQKLLLWQFSSISCLTTILGSFHLFTFSTHPVITVMHAGDYQIRSCILNSWDISEMPAGLTVQVQGKFGFLRDFSDVHAWCSRSKMLYLMCNHNLAPRLTTFPKFRLILQQHYNCVFSPSGVEPNWLQEQHKCSVLADCWLAYKSNTSVPALLTADWAGPFLAIFFLSAQDNILGFVLTQEKKMKWISVHTSSVAYSCVNPLHSIIHLVPSYQLSFRIDQPWPISPTSYQLSPFVV